MALAWEDADSLDDDGAWWLALLSEPAVGGPLGIFERFAAARPAWQAQAACRARTDISWFTEADVTAAVAVCATCPVAEPCRAYGAREAGVWAGKPHKLRRARPDGGHAQPAPARPN